jgi:hypothetical protein
MYSPKGFNGKLLKYFNIFFQMRIYTFFLVILIEIFILKTRMYHKYNLHYKNTHKKMFKKRSILR